MTMMKRLQVLIPETELRDLQRVAKRHHMTTAAFVRQAIRDAQVAAEGPSAIERLARIRDASRHAYPTAGIDTMLAEIERGYAGPEA